MNIDKLIYIIVIIFSISGCKDKKSNQCSSLNSQETSTKRNDFNKKPVSSTHKETVFTFKLPPSGEGMWPWFDLHKLNESKLIEKGLKIKLKDIWNGKEGLASAVVGMRGCSASFISKNGLIITNHHCAFRAIQRNSTKEKNLLKDGFLAKNQSEELNGFGTVIYVFKSQTDVTKNILSGMPKNIKDEDIIPFIESREKEIIAGCEKKKNRKCRISRENNGLRFLLLENIEIRDVRLVAVPPRSVGEYGGEIDNWQWPRHTLDFSILRAYVAKNGQTAEYSKDNIPYHPKRFLKIGSGDFQPGDMVMVMGTPYHTARYAISSDLKEKLEWYYPLRVSLFSEWISVLEEIAKRVPDAKIKVQTMIKRLNNGLTNSRGQITGLKRNKTIQKKLIEEEKWKKWVNSSKKIKPSWKPTLSKLKQFYSKKDIWKTHDILMRYLFYGVKTLSFARTITKLATESLKKDIDREKGYMNRDKKSIFERLKYAQKGLSSEADRKVFVMFLRRIGKLPQTERIQFVDKQLNGNYEQKSIESYVNKLISGTKLFDEKARLALLGQTLGNLKKSTDPMIKLAFGIHDEVESYILRNKKKSGILFKLLPPYLESLSLFKGSMFYPDANASPRVSFATNFGYSPRDGIWATPFTTLSGMLQKNRRKDPFDLPPILLKTAKKRGISKYKSKLLKDIPICFLSNADTTGGNSGSPALNGKGEFIGLNFDRVYENISGDYGYDNERSRNIMVHVKAIMWYLDEVMGAKNIVSELVFAGK